MTPSTKRGIGAVASGFVFGAGLVVSGMSDPKRVLGFLNLRGEWDPSLLLVMVAATSIYFAAFRWSRGRSAALDGEPFMLPSRQHVDTRLLLGAALFGIGWGISGFCPAPSIVALASASPRVIVFVAASLAGSLLVQRLEAARTRSAANETRRSAEVGGA